MPFFFLTLEQTKQKKNHNGEIYTHSVTKLKKVKADQ